MSNNQLSVFTDGITVIRERGGFWEPLISMSCMPCGYVLCMVTRLRWPQVRPAVRFLVEHCCIILPVVLSVVEVPVARYLLITLSSALLAITAIVWLIVTKFCHRRMGIDIIDDCEHQETMIQHLQPLVDSCGRINCLTTFRGCLYIATCVAILGRDLPAFHLDWAKAHNFGCGLMDVGIGSFVLAMGQFGPTTRTSKKPMSHGNVMLSTARQSLLLFLLGMVRFLFVKFRVATASEDEYGRDWNVFFSLSAVKFLGTPLELILPRRVSPLFTALLLSIMYEYVLVQGHLAKYIIQPNLDDILFRSSGWFAANREGVSSLAGLLSLYLSGVQIGRWAMKTKEAADVKAYQYLLYKLLLLAACTSVPQNLLRYVYPDLQNLPSFVESRRMANMAYCLWMVSFATYLTAFALIADLIFQKFKLPTQHELNFNTYIREVDKHGLCYFVLANLLTGFVNLIIISPYKKLVSKEVPPIYSVFIIFLYMLILLFGAKRLSPLLRIL